MNKLFLFVGPTAIGGTYWIIKFCALYPNTFCEVRSVTTRPKRPHDPNEETRYVFVSKEEFLKKKSDGAFLETDMYNGHYYGTLREEIDRALLRSHAFMKITALGARNIARALGTACVITFLIPANEGVLRKNLLRRHQALGQSPERIEHDLKKAHEYLMHMSETLAYMPHEHITISGTDKDMARFLIIFLKHGVLI